MKASVLPLAVLALVLGTLRAQTERSQADSNPQHAQWVAESIKVMQSVKPGMTRADLLRVFTTEGGESTGLRRTYVYRQCPYFKVDVDFEAVGRPSRDGDGRVTLVESGADTIKAISKPYLQFSIGD
jgi:hypothetical protein